MSKTLFTAVFVGAISGAVSAAVITLLIEPSSSGRAAQAIAAAPSSKAGTPGVSPEALAKLENQNQLLELRIASLEARPQGTPFRAPVESPASSAKSGGKSDTAERAVEARFIGADGLVSPVYYEDFKAASILYEEEKSQQREEQRRLEREKRSEERLVELSHRLGLDEYQTGRVRGIINNQDAQRMAAIEAMKSEDGHDLSRDEIKENMRMIEESANSAMQAVLTPMQYEEYQTTSRRGIGNRGGDANNNRGPGIRGGGRGDG